MSNADSIETSRLRLELLCLEVLELLRAQKVEEASRVQGFEFTREFLASINEVFLTRQLDGLRKRPLTPGWFVRAIIRNADGSVIGHCGFHGAPDDIGRAEVGYIIYSPYRRCGYATESVEGLVEWARSQGSHKVFVTVATSNTASLGVIRKLGFTRSSAAEESNNRDEYVFQLSL